MSLIFTQIKNITYNMKLFGKLNYYKNLVIVNFRIEEVSKGNLVFLWGGGLELWKGGCGGV